MSDKIMTIIERAKLVAQDVLAASEVVQSNLYFNPTPRIELYRPSKQLLNIMDEHEVQTTLQYLQKIHLLSFEHLPSNYDNSVAYNLSIDVNGLRALIEHEEPEMPKIDLQDIPTSGVAFDKVRATLTINGIDIPLGRTEGDKTLQYWVCFYTTQKPNKPIEELKILNSYKKDYGLEARSRAVRDAVIVLNRKIKAKVKPEPQKDLFIYSRGKVTYVEENIGPYNFVSVKM